MSANNILRFTRNYFSYYVIMALATVLKYRGLVINKRTRKIWNKLPSAVFLLSFDMAVFKWSVNLFFRAGNA